MVEQRVLIAAAGRGSRVGLPYPKTLFPVKGKPILVGICELLWPIDRVPTIVVSPSGRDPVARCLSAHGLDAIVIEQPEPRGMGDAVLRFRESPASTTADDVLLIWGDIPFVRPATILSLVEGHRENANDFTFVTAQVDAPYTIVTRDEHGSVRSVIETREGGIPIPSTGERDIGVFLFRPQVVLPLLQSELPDRLGVSSKEHGFLYIIRHLVKRGYRVEGLPIGGELDVVSFNSISDIASFI